jgi:hypothetical protein
LQENAVKILINQRSLAKPVAAVRLLDSRMAGSARDEEDVAEWLCLETSWKAAENLPLLRPLPLEFSKV